MQIAQACTNLGLRGMIEVNTARGSFGDLHL
jgi:hypothetical protein